MCQVVTFKRLKAMENYKTVRPQSGRGCLWVSMIGYWLACEQALRGVLAVGREKEGELATMSLEFKYLHQKSRCEMLIGGDDISNDVITLGTCFSMFVYIGAGFCFALTVDGVPQGNWRWNSNSRDVVASSPSFSRPATRSPRKVCSQARHWPGKFWCLG